MRTYEETTRRILARRDEALLQKPAKRMRIMKYSAMAASICVLAAGGIYAAARLHGSAPEDSLILYEEDSRELAQETATTAPAEESAAETTLTAETAGTSRTRRTASQPQITETQPVLSDAYTGTLSVPAELAQRLTTVSTASTKQNVTGTTGQTTLTTRQTTAAGTSAATTIPTQSTSTTNTNLLWVEPRWDEKSLPQQYPSFDHPMRNVYMLYRATGHPVNAGLIGKKLTDMTMFGHDVYTDEQHKIQAELFQIKGISETTEPLLAVRFAGDSAYYAYCINRDDYAFRNVGDFVQSLNLTEYAGFGRIIITENSEELTGVTSSEFRDKVFTELLDAGVYENACSTDFIGKCWKESPFTVQFGLNDVGVPVGSAFRISEDGYVQTSLFGYSATLYVGTERTDAFNEWLSHAAYPERVAWDNRSMTSQYLSFQHPLMDSCFYYGADPATTLDPNRIGKHVADIVMYGYDFHTDTGHQRNAEIFAVQGIPESLPFLQAVRFEGDDRYYAYVLLFDKYDETIADADYVSPFTVGDYVQGLNLPVYAEFGTDLRYVTADGATESHALPAQEIKDRIFTQLLDTDVCAEKYTLRGSQMARSSYVSLKISMPELGVQKGYQFNVLAKGIVETNLLGYWIAVDVGEERAQAFIEWVQTGQSDVVVTTITTAPVQTDTALTTATTSVPPNYEIMAEPSRFPVLAHPLTGRDLFYHFYGTADASVIGEKIADMPMKGKDKSGNDAVVQAEVFRIRGITGTGTTEALLAVRFPGDDQYYSYFRQVDAFSYSSLGEMLEQTGFKAYAEFPLLLQKNDAPDGYTHFPLAGISPDEIRERLYSSLFSTGVYDTACEKLGRRLDDDAPVTVYLSLPQLGRINAGSIKVLRDGWVEMNLYYAGRRFYVGEERTNAFIDWALANGIPQDVGAPDYVPDGYGFPDDIIFDDF